MRKERKQGKKQFWRASTLANLLLTQPNAKVIFNFTYSPHVSLTTDQAVVVYNEVSGKWYLKVIDGEPEKET